jgi:c-di-GMP-binding flagellar brake protein YcgR
MVIQVKEFIYRRPRHKTDIPVLVRFTPVYSIPGRCIDISAAGLGARLGEAVPIGKVVQLEFVLEARAFSIPARVQYRCSQNYYGLTFQFSSELEQVALERLLAAIYTIK